MKEGQEFRLTTKKKILGDHTYGVCDFNDLPNKVKSGDHMIVDFGSVCLKVIGFEDEAEFFANNPGDVSLVHIFENLKYNTALIL